jgi:putative restriction endonuclease
VDPGYDDLPEERYHFPQTYLRQAEAALNDWIIYYEPRRPTTDVASRGGRQCYFATAHVDRIQKDQHRADHFYAYVSQYLEFDRPVPFREGLHYYERGLQRDDGGTNKGAFGRAVRPLRDEEYDLILRAGFAPILGAAEQATELETALSLAESPAEFDRPVVERVVARPFRDAAFAWAVKNAYGETCAVTGLKIINGGGRAEVQAAHIRPVADRGPDSVRNGLALCSTIHWMFDRGLVSVEDDFGILVARDRVPDTVARLVHPDGKLALPDRPELRPHPHFLRYHRERVFKG